MSLAFHRFFRSIPVWTKPPHLAYGIAHDLHGSSCAATYPPLGVMLRVVLWGARPAPKGETAQGRAPAPLTFR